MGTSLTAEQTTFVRTAWAHYIQRRDWPFRRVLADEFYRRDLDVDEVVAGHEGLSAGKHHSERVWASPDALRELPELKALEGHVPSLVELARKRFIEQPANDPQESARPNHLLKQDFIDLAGDEARGRELAFLLEFWNLPLNLQSIGADYADFAVQASYRILKYRGAQTLESLRHIPNQDIDGPTVLAPSDAQVALLRDTYWRFCEGGDWPQDLKVCLAFAQSEYVPEVLNPLVPNFIRAKFNAAAHHHIELTFRALMVVDESGELKEAVVSLLKGILGELKCRRDVTRIEGTRLLDITGLSPEVLRRVWPFVQHEPWFGGGWPPGGKFDCHVTIVDPIYKMKSVTDFASYLRARAQYFPDVDTTWGADPLDSEGRTVKREPVALSDVALGEQLAHLASLANGEGVDTGPADVELSDSVTLEGGPWRFDATQAPRTGASGVVYQGRGPKNEVVAVKHIDKPKEGYRELDIIAEIRKRSGQHLMPVLDAGHDDIDGRGIFIVMPWAERSLEEFLRGTGPLGESDAVAILRQVATGLVELNGIAHRDLKPSNILEQNGLWKLADFGIAKLIGTPTTESTRRQDFSALYAAPEQWRFEDPTPSTDVYALGCIAFKLVTGRLPFDGDDLELARAHQWTPAPPLGGVSGATANLVAACVRKDFTQRPQPNELLASLESWSPNKRPKVHPRLAALGAALEREFELHTIASRERKSTREQREAQAREQHHNLEALLSRLAESIREGSGRAVIHRDSVYLGGVGLTWRMIIDVLHPEDHPGAEIDVIAGYQLRLARLGDTQTLDSANLWLRPEAGSGRRRWFEASYVGREVGNARESGRGAKAFGLTSENLLIHAALAGTDDADSIKLVHPMVPIDGADEEAFLERWTLKLVDAAQQVLSAPKREAD